MQTDISRVRTITGMGSSGTLSPALAGAIGSISPKNAFMDPDSIVVEYSTNSGSTWTTWDIGDTMKKGIVNPAGSPNSYFKLGGPNAQRNTSYQSRITFKADNLYSSIVGIYLWINDRGNTVVCDVERSTIGNKTTFTKIVEGIGVSGWGGPNWISLSPMTWGGGSSQTSNGYAIRLTFRYMAVSTSGVSEVGEIALIGVTNWSISDNMACRGHMYTWDTSKNVSFPANVNAPTFSGNGSALTSLNASNLTSGTVPIGRIPTGTTSSTVALGNHTHSYAGSPSAGGSANTLYSPRITTTANYKPGANRSEMREFESSAPNIPTTSYYHILTTEGPDTAYATQLAMGMTTTNIAYRNLNVNTWSAWQTILTSGNYKTYCTPANIGAATSGHTHSNYLTTTGTAAAATKLATARTIALSGDVTGSTSFNGTANVTITAVVANDSHSHSDSTITSLAASKITGTLPVAHGGTGVTSLVGSSGLLGKLHTTSSDSDSSVSTYICSFSSNWAKGGYIPLNNLRSLIGAAASSHTHSYLPLSGGTLTGRLTANAKISATTSGGKWINGKTVTNAGYCITTQPDSAGNSYYPFFAAKSGSGHTVNLGCLGNAWGFYGFKSSRTDNGTDWQFTFDAGTGAITHNSTMTITGQNFNYKNTNCSTFTTSSSATAANGNSRVYFTNNNNQCMGEALTGVDSTNYSFMRMEAVRPNGSATYYNTLNLKLGPTGQYLYSVTSAAAFRNSLGLGNTSGALPVLNGGTGTTAKGKTLLSNIGITSGTGSAPSSGTNGCIYIQYS